MVNVYKVADRISVMQWHIRRRGHLKSGRKYGRMSKKRKYERGRDFVPATIGDKRVKVKRTRGGSVKFIATLIEFVSVAIAGKVQKSKVVTVKENPANPQWVRSNIITKGALIETELGTARVTSRPGQSGSVDAILIEPAKKE